MVKAVLFLSPELEDSISSCLRENTQWDVAVYSTGPKRTESLTDVPRLTELLQGADICFISTFTDFNNARIVEVQEGVAIAQACKKAEVRNVILSSHLHCENTIGIPAKHYDAKAEIYQFMRNTLGIPATMVNIPPLYEMFYDTLCPYPTRAGDFEFVLPAVTPAPIDFMAQIDIGYCLLPIMENPEVFRTKTVPLCGDKLSGKMVMAILNEELEPMKFKQKQVTVQEFRDLGFLGSIDIANMFEFLGRADLKANPSGTLELYPGTKNFRGWVRQNKERLADAIINNRRDAANISAIL